MKIAICEDEQLWRNKLINMVEHWADSRNIKLSLRCFPDSESFWFSFQEEKDWDLLLLDIEMGQENGMELAEKIRREGNDTAIVFTTGYAEFMSRSFDVEAMHYLLKPVNEEKLQECLDRVLNRNIQEIKIPFETADQIRISLPPSQICYLEACKHQCILYTKEEPYQLKTSITATCDLLSEEQVFIKCHRSYIVNLRWIKEIRKNEITLDDGRILPVSRSAFGPLNEAFVRYYRKQEVFS